MIKQRLIKTASCGIASMALMMPLASPVLAETIIIGKGTGKVWEGMPFDVTLIGSLHTQRHSFIHPLMAITDNNSSCMLTNKLIKIDGYLAFPLARGVGLIPQASGSVTYGRFPTGIDKLTGTIGLPETKGFTQSEANITPDSSRVWCLPATRSMTDPFFSGIYERKATLSGNWVLVADGSQESAEISLPPLYFASLSYNSTGNLGAPILPTNISLRVSTLECSVNTPTTIDFGSVIRNTQANAELAVKQVQLFVACEQTGINRINANINVQFRAISGLYNTTASRLALNQGGGYITGEIDNGVTGSGDCKATTGLPFDGTLIKLGSIIISQRIRTLTNQLTWRLCSGGGSVPIGAVTASTEMLVTFN